MNTNNIADRQSFIRFVRELQQDFQQNGQHWENQNLDHFLEALAGYAEDIQEYYDNTNLGINADLPTWRVFADMLKGASIYE